MRHRLGEEGHIQLDESGGERVAEHRSIGSAVFGEHLRHEPPDDDQGDGDEHRDPVQPQADEEAGESEDGPDHQLRYEIDLAAGADQRASELEDAQQAGCQGEQDEDPLQEDQ